MDSSSASTDAVYLKDTDRSVKSWVYTHFRDCITDALKGTGATIDDLTGFFESDDRYYDDLLGFVVSYVNADSLVLDMGCAVGRFAMEIGRSVKRVYGVDPSSECIRAANEIFRSGDIPVLFAGDRRGDGVPEKIHTDRWSRSRAEFLVADDASMPYQDGMFDCVCCISVIDRVPDAEAFLRRVDRVVKRGGTLIITDPFDWNDQYSPETRWFGHGAFGTKKGSEEDALAELLKRYGYTRIAERNILWRTYSHRRNHKVWTVYAAAYRKA